MDGHQQVLIRELLQTLMSVQFINADFFRWTRPETRYDRQSSGKKTIYGYTLSHLFAQGEELSKNLVVVEAL